MSTWPTEEPKKPILNAREAVKISGDDWRIISGYSYADVLTCDMKDFYVMQMSHRFVRGRESISVKHNLLAWR